MGTGRQISDAARSVVEADKNATHTLAAHRDHPAMKLAGWASELADQPPLIALSLGTLALGLVTRRGALVRGGGRMLAAHLAATAVKAVVKSLVDRARPAHAMETGDQRFEAGEGSEHHELNSFPSGHTAGAVAVARAASRDIDGAAAPAALATVAVAAAQVPSGHHYLLDVIVGGAIGWLSEAAVSAIIDQIEWPPRRD